MAPDTCGAGLPNAGHRCTGGNPMAQRNYPCDSLIVAYFGTSRADLDAVGEGAFKKQLWLCMAGMALKVKAEVEKYRSQNIFGLLVWQLNEVRPDLIFLCLLACCAACLYLSCQPNLTICRSW